MATAKCRTLIAAESSSSSRERERERVAPPPGRARPKRQRCGDWRYQATDTKLTACPARIAPLLVDRPGSAPRMSVAPPMEPKDFEDGPMRDLSREIDRLMWRTAEDLPWTPRAAAVRRLPDAIALGCAVRF